MKHTLLLATTLTTGCGSGLWLLTPRLDTTYQEITRTTRVQVSSNTPGATVLVDGAESGPRSACGRPATRSSRVASACPTSRRCAST